MVGKETIEIGTPLFLYHIRLIYNVNKWIEKTVDNTFYMVYDTHIESGSTPAMIGKTCIEYDNG